MNDTNIYAEDAERKPPEARPDTDHLYHAVCFSCGAKSNLVLLPHRKHGKVVGMIFGCNDHAIKLFGTTLYPECELENLRAENHRLYDELNSELTDNVRLRTALEKIVARPHKHAALRMCDKVCEALLMSREVAREALEGR